MPKSKCHKTPSWSPSYTGNAVGNLQDGSPRNPASWYSCLHIILSRWVCAEPCVCLLMHRIRPRLWDITLRGDYKETVAFIMHPFSLNLLLASSEGNQVLGCEQHDGKAHVARNQRRPLATSREKQNSASKDVSEPES